MPDAFYEALSETRFRPTSATVGPWGPTLSHGSPPAALLLRAIERAFPRDDARVARIAYDFFGPVPVAELEIATEMVRPGARIELTRARLSSGGKTVMTASAWRIAVAPARVPEVRDARAVPALPPPQNLPLFVDVPTFGYGEALDWRFVEGRFDRLGPATVYARPKVPLVTGETVSPLGRLLLMVDSANGVSAELQPSQFTFVPVELTVSVSRHPKTEWVGMSARTTIDPDGVGHTRADLFDEAGYIGTALQTLFVAPR
ncbi:MAG TPA: thioesterase family protein [Polyangiaceae bacterium]